MTDAQAKALRWLIDRGGDAVFDRHGVVLAQGDTAPIERKTWNALHDAGKIEFYNPSGKGYGRLRVINSEGAQADRHETTVDPAKYRYGRVQPLPGADDQ